MAEFIHDSNSLIAIFLPQRKQEKSEFYTPLEEPLQCGIGVFKKGSSVEPHKHIGVPAEVAEFQEFIFIRRGKAQAEVYGTKGNFLRTLEMNSGDALLLLRGGHAFHFLEDTELLEVKQGPYKGREKMKQPLRPSRPAPLREKQVEAQL